VWIQPIDGGIRERAGIDLLGLGGEVKPRLRNDPSRFATRQAHGKAARKLQAPPRKPVIRLATVGARVVGYGARRTGRAAGRGSRRGPTAVDRAKTDPPEAQHRTETGDR